MIKIIALYLVAGFLLAVTPVLAQEEEVAKKYGITFPIAELGNCGSISACKSYCDNTENIDKCISFAKAKGFDKEVGAPNQDVLSSAQSELGCNSEGSCRTICEKEENFDRCSSFAQKHNLGSPRGNPGDRKVLNKARDLLGCDSESSCRAVCEQEANQQRCSEFASQSGLGGGIRKVGPGGCNSEASCRAFCEGNPAECEKFGGGPPAGRESNRRGPGGCNSEESCRAYCEKNPEECSKRSALNLAGGMVSLAVAELAPVVVVVRRSAAAGVKLIPVSVVVRDLGQPKLKKNSARRIQINAVMEEIDPQRDLVATEEIAHLKGSVLNLSHNSTQTNLEEGVE